jgi:hypothetical protein
MNPLLSRLNVDSRWFFAILCHQFLFRKRRYTFLRGTRRRRRRLSSATGRVGFRFPYGYGSRGCSLLFSICALIVGSVWILNNDYFIRVYSYYYKSACCYSTCWVRTNQFCIDVRPEGLNRRGGQMKRH